MKHLKLYEQFEDEEEPWWEKPSSYDSEKDLKIVRHSAGMNQDLYIMVIDKNNKTDRVKLFDRNYTDFPISFFETNPNVFDEDVIYVLKDNYMNKTFKYKDLPKEIKDRLI